MVNQGYLGDDSISAFPPHRLAVMNQRCDPQAVRPTTTPSLSTPSASSLCGMACVTYVGHGRPRSCMVFASAGFTAVFLLRGAAGFGGHASTRFSTPRGSTSAAAVPFSNQHGWQGSRLARRARLRSSIKGRRCARADRLFLCSGGLPAAPAAVKEDGPAGSDEAQQA